jgi:hypothetical protein
MVDHFTINVISISIAIIRIKLNGKLILIIGKFRRITGLKAVSTRRCAIYKEKDKGLGSFILDISRSLVITVTSSPQPTLSAGKNWEWYRYNMLLVSIGVSQI